MAGFFDLLIEWQGVGKPSPTFLHNYSFYGESYLSMPPPPSPTFKYVLTALYEPD